MKKFQKKLILNKQDVVNLNNEKMEKIKGGDVSREFPSACVDWETKCITVTCQCGPQHTDFCGTNDPIVSCIPDCPPEY